MNGDLRTSFTGSIPEHYDRLLGPASLILAARELVKLDYASGKPAGPGMESRGLLLEAMREPGYPLIVTRARA